MSGLNTSAPPSDSAAPARDTERESRFYDFNLLFERQTEFKDIDARLHNTVALFYHLIALEEGDDRVDTWKDALVDELEDLEQAVQDAADRNTQCHESDAPFPRPYELSDDRLALRQQYHRALSLVDAGFSRSTDIAERLSAVCRVLYGILDEGVQDPDLRVPRPLAEEDEEEAPALVDYGACAASGDDDKDDDDDNVEMTD
jgi:hypothetical protein